MTTYNDWCLHESVRSRKSLVFADGHVCDLCNIKLGA